ncbi:MAG: hypothetical protein AB7O97_06290 [Planctomycetota bacterium]
MNSSQRPAAHRTVRARSLLRPLSRCALLLAAAAPLTAQLPDGVTREQMWYAPTAEDWKKPVQITFQRTWDDAVRLAQEQKRAILVCINMDGEIASEHYAGIRYRQPEIAALYEPYVCVMASVYRHNPRDYDEHGHRIPCPRFGSVTCGEHIAIEPLLYEKFMDGRRIAPRHIMVELDGSEVYDVYYAFDTDSVFAAIKNGIENRAIRAEPVVRGDRSILERVASADVRDREAVEQAFADGDAPMKDALLAAAAQLQGDAPVDLLRLGVFGLDVDRAQQARATLSQTDQGGAVDLIAEALRVPMDQGERDRLVAALRRLGETSPQARTLAAVHDGLAGTDGGVDVRGWAQALADAQPPAAAATSYAIEAELQQQEQALLEAPRDAAAHLQLAESTLQLAVQYEPSPHENQRWARRHARLLLEDAKRAARRAGELGVDAVVDGTFRLHALLAACAWHQRDFPTAYKEAEQAAQILPQDASSYAAMAAMQIFAEARQNAIVDAIRNKTEWPPQWLTDVHTAYSVLARHPLGRDFHVADHYDFVRALSAHAEADRILAEGLQRFPESPMLHERLRDQLLRQRGIDGLERAYVRMLEQRPTARTAWFAGYATLVVAEQHRRQGEATAALEAYDRAIARYERCAAADPETRSNVDHYLAIAHAGRARVLLEQDDLAGATDQLLAAFAQKPEATATMDGLNISAADTARMLRAKLTTAERKDLLQRLEQALLQLDPELLRLPAYEGQGPGPRPGAGGRRGRRPGGQGEQGAGDGGR